MIAPYVSERLAWIVKVHPEFQQYYCFDVDFEHRPLDLFRPMVERVFAREPWTATD